MTGATRALLAWDGGIGIYVLFALALFLTEPQEKMPAAAERQEEGEWTIFFITVGVVVFSLVAVLSAFSGIKGASPEIRTVRVTLVGVTLILSWLMTHVTFAFRYAHEYYEARPGGGYARGLQFPAEPGDDSPPDYADFLYFSVVLGMTFQVSDVQITARPLRKLALMHGLLSFLFNTTIVALTVNLAAGLLA